MSGTGWSHPVFKTRHEFDQRTNELLREEAQEPTQWWYLSFANAESFLGGLYIRAKGVMSATMLASRMGLNPGGEVMSMGPISDEQMDANVPEEKRLRLLTAEEVNE